MCLRIPTTQDKNHSNNLVHTRSVKHAIFFSQGYSLHFFLILDHLWWFGVRGFGVGVLFWVFGVGAFS